MVRRPATSSVIGVGDGDGGNESRGREDRWGLGRSEEEAVVGERDVNGYKWGKLVSEKDVNGYKWGQIGT